MLPVELNNNAGPLHKSSWGLLFISTKPSRHYHRAQVYDQGLALGFTCTPRTKHEHATDRHHDKTDIFAQRLPRAATDPYRRKTAGRAQYHLAQARAEVLLPTNPLLNRIAQGVVVRPIAKDWFRILKVQAGEAQLNHLGVMINGCALEIFLDTTLDGLAREQQARFISETSGDHASITLAQGPNFQ